MNTSNVSIISIELCTASSCFLCHSLLKSIGDLEDDLILEVLADNHEAYGQPVVEAGIDGYGRVAGVVGDTGVLANTIGICNKI